MQSKKYQCLNINVITLVVYATNNKFIYYGQKPAKNPNKNPPKIHGNSPLTLTKTC
jgi:hypothetical protein